MNYQWRASSLNNSNAEAGCKVLINHYEKRNPEQQRLNKLPVSKDGYVKGLLQVDQFANNVVQSHCRKVKVK
jgi:hypothetical protein